MIASSPRVMEEPESDESPRVLRILPRDGAQETRHFRFECGRLVELDPEKQTAEQGAKKATKVDEVIAHIEATYKIGALFRQADLKSANGNWASQTIQDAFGKMRKDNRLSDEPGNGKYCRTGREYAAATAKYVGSLNGEAFTGEQLARAASAKPIDEGDDFVERVLRFHKHAAAGVMIADCVGPNGLMTIERLSEGSYRRWHG